MKSHITVVEIRKDKHKVCGRVLRSLPGWFGIEEAINSYENCVKDTVMFDAKAGSRIVGFLSLRKYM